MPGREDEYWASEKESKTNDLRYCYKHHCYYHVKSGCQFCGIDNAESIARTTNNKDKSIPVKNCPACKKPSLYFIAQTNQWECFNSKCSRIFSIEELAEREKQNQIILTPPEINTENPKNSAEPPNSSKSPVAEARDLIRCPNCFKISLFWIQKSSSYECLNPKCRWIYTEEQLAEEIRLRKEEPKGRAWFGNEYFDPKKRKWRKS